MQSTPIELPELPEAATVTVNGEIRGVGPIDFRPLPPVKVAPISELRAVVERARIAQEAWAARSLDDRIAALRRVAKRMLDNRLEIVALMRDEIGKLEVDGLMSEALGPLDQVNAWAKVVREATARKHAKLNPIAFPKKRAWYDLLPRGVVGIIAPWNYPMAGYYRNIIPALLTGNAVVLKPSEMTPRTARWFLDQIESEVPECLVNLAPGDGTVGAALLEADIDACVFTGSVEVGKRVRVKCAELGIPFSAEMGGNDPALVLADCDLDRTAAGITHWALHNVGQACGAVEIALVDAGIADLFVDRLRRSWSKLRAGPGPFAEVDVSPMASRDQMAIVQRHVTDAQAKGATLVCGGRPVGAGLWYEPTLLDGCTEAMDVIREETFGPVLAIIRVKGTAEAVEIANRLDYGLTASIWTADLGRAERLAGRLDYGVVTVNNHSLTGAMPQLPWSGHRATGYSVASSALSLATFTRPKTVLIDRNADPEPFWMPFDRNLWELGETLADAQLARLERVWRLPLLLPKRIKKVRDFFRGA